MLTAHLPLMTTTEHQIDDSEIDSEMVSVVDSDSVNLKPQPVEEPSNLLATSQQPLVLMSPLLSEDEDSAGEQEEEQVDKAVFKFMTVPRQSRHSDPMPDMLDLISNSTSSSGRVSISSAPSVTKGPWTKEV